MTYWVRALVTKADDLSWIPEIHILGGRAELTLQDTSHTHAHFHSHSRSCLFSLSISLTHTK